MRVKISVPALLIAFVVVCRPACAQSANDVANIFGGLMQSVIARTAQAEWQKLPPGDADCIDRALRQQGWSLDSAIRQGILPSDARVSAARVSCRSQLPQQQPAAVQTQGYPQYVVDGLYLGGRVQFGSPSYLEYGCRPSEQFAGFTFCQKQRLERERRGNFASSYSLLHAADGTAVYVNRALEPAFFSGDEAKADIERLSKRLGNPNVIAMPRQSDVPFGMIASWGGVVLEPLDGASLKSLADGRELRVGFMIDHIGNLRKSARLGMPVYRLRGGPGFVWAASWNAYGVGSLQFLAINASAFDSGNPVSGGQPVAAAKPESPTEEDVRKAAADNAAAEKAEADRVAAQKAAAEKAAADRLAAEKEAAERAEAARLAAEKAAAERAEAARIAAEKAAAERAAAEKAAAEKAAKEAEIELARKAELRQKGLAYATASGTRWTIVRKLNEMTDRTDVAVESVQQNEEGVVAEVRGSCRNGEVSFSGLVVDTKGKPSISIPGRTPFGNDTGSGVSVLYRVNDAEPYNTFVPELEFSNKFQLAVFASPAGKSETVENTNRLLLSMLGVVRIFLKAADTWRVMVELKTTAGPIIVKIPIFDGNIQELFQACR